MNGKPSESRPASETSRLAATLSCLARALLLGALTSLALPLARAAPPADACVEGYVWREAYPGDPVCVTPEEREQAAQDNRLAASRREPQGGLYGPDTCKPGFVWREARPGDHVCVTPEVREQTARANRLAPTRRLLPPAAPNGARGDSERNGAAVRAPAPARPEMSRPVPREAMPDMARSAPRPQPAPAPVMRESLPRSAETTAYHFKLPEFPWPPPPYSTRLKLDRALLVATQPAPTNGSVAARMEQALAANGYTLVSYYAVPDGFALITQVERMDPDAASAAEQRWSTQIDPVKLIPFSLDAYINALLGKNGDSFRVIVFAFTPTPFTTGGQAIPPAQAMAWVEKGATALPATLAAQPYGNDTVCTALVYEFRISSLGTALQRPSAHDGQRHLRAAGILGTLEQLP